jgi:hypothetical protein
MSRIGIIESVVNNTVNLVGYGEYLGNEIERDEEFDIDIEIPVVMLDNGNKIKLNQYYWAEEESIKAELETYELKGYSIKTI